MIAAGSAAEQAKEIGTEQLPQRKLELRFEVDARLSQGKLGHFWAFGSLARMKLVLPVEPKMAAPWVLTEHALADANQELIGSDQAAYFR